MKVTDVNERQFAPLKGRTYFREGYEVEILLPLAVRYREANCSVTAFADMLSDEPSWAKHLPDLLRPFFSQLYFQVWIEEPMVCDNTDGHPETPPGLIESRMAEALEANHIKYVFRKRATC
jgi:hypothetical protein